MSSDTTTFDLHVEAGTTFVVEFFLKEDQETPMNLTGYEARSQVRPSYMHTGVPILEFTSPSGGIVINNSEGKLTLTINPEQTIPIAGSSPKELLYDVEIFTVAGVVYRPFKGKITIYPEITK
jgi:hypothetical protein